ncbi:uncharacterized protein CG3556 [Caerostris extrusa]|uniref:Uncharacterized protein CG3556 n=1 Tax=Caerostris extrusa TaxID=172846 RepID=A0AAV4XG17_CAEEX|nr:uncharacterized protein CG3556 [Caerostris extrusa]
MHEGSFSVGKIIVIVRLGEKGSNSFHPCDRATVKILIPESDQEFQFCSTSDDPQPISAIGNVTVVHKIGMYKPPGFINPYSSKFTLEYNIMNLECADKNSFRCDNHTCVSKEKRCNGVKDCPNGIDEIGCEKGVLAVRGVAKARENGIFWLKRQINISREWEDNTPRAAVALYLSSGAGFNGTNLAEELMVKQLELKTAVSLLRNSLSNNELSMLINALLVTCHNPRHFYGKNLVSMLKRQIEDSRNFTHPIAYLALCNSNEPWPVKAYSDLENILNNDEGYPFADDLQALAVIALACKKNSTSNSFQFVSYQSTIESFKEKQLSDGSFGNIYTTALITQALISSGHELKDDWNLNATVEYLMNNVNSLSIDLLSTYLILPILNGKTMADISKIDCSSNPRTHDPKSEIGDYLGQKIRVKYSLYIGDEREVIYSISLRVPKNYTAYDVMKLAAEEDSKYRFEMKKTSGQMYIYEIAKITNDPEDGKFWLLYVQSSNNTESLEHLSTTSPEEIVMNEGDELIFWYKTASI